MGRYSQYLDHARASWLARSASSALRLFRLPHVSAKQHTSQEGRSFSHHLQNEKGDIGYALFKNGNLRLCLASCCTGCNAGRGFAQRQSHVRLRDGVCRTTCKGIRGIQLRLDYSKRPFERRASLSKHHYLSVVQATYGVRSHELHAS